MIIAVREEGLRLPLDTFPGLDPVGLFASTATNRDRRLVASVTEDDRRVWFLGASEARWPGFVMLDLSDPATRDRLLRHLATRLDVAPSCGVSWDVSMGWYRLNGVDAIEADLPRRFAAVAGRADDLLGDGSRYVDALALALAIQAQPRQAGGGA